LKIIEPTTATGMVIEVLQEFESPIYCQNGDEVRLSVENKLVCARKIEDIEIITHWACIKIDCSIGFMLGGPDLEKSLLMWGFKYADS